MIRAVVFFVALIFAAAGAAIAQEAATTAHTACLTKAVDKNGKELAGAAKTKNIKKCCETAAVSSEGKKLTGAAKTSFVKKCTES
jgi:hypothetical protein